MRKINHKIKLKKIIRNLILIMIIKMNKIIIIINQVIINQKFKQTMKSQITVNTHKVTKTKIILMKESMMKIINKTMTQIIKMQTKDIKKRVQRVNMTILMKVKLISTIKKM